MKALEFKTKISGKYISIPRKTQRELAVVSDGGNANVRVVLLITDGEIKKTSHNNGIDEAMDDVAKGRVYAADDAKSLIAQCLL
ncbi:MAG: hypothetical protein LBR50_08930 [Tannerella sp.]|jgi:hypothetical protein|nr:hypothetical protein [Tannerella sp.]